MLDRPRRGARYEIVVGGELDSRYSHFFNGMVINREKGTTTLTGDVADQAQLRGFIDRFEELGLDLVLVEQLLPALNGAPQRGRT